MQPDVRGTLNFLTFNFRIKKNIVKMLFFFYAFLTFNLQMSYL